MIAAKTTALTELSNRWGDNLMSKELRKQIRKEWVSPFIMKKNIYPEKKFKRVESLR